MRSRPYKEHDTIRDRIYQERLHALIAGQRQPHRICMIWDGRLVQGWASGHRTPAARRWRTRLRIWRRLHPLKVE